MGAPRQGQRTMIAVNHQEFTTKLFVVLSALTLGCNAIIRRDDKPDSDYIVQPSLFPAVFAFPQKGECGATLIAKQWGITAAHCFDVKGAFIVKAPFKVTIANETNYADKILLAPCYNMETSSPPGADVALFKLRYPVEHVTPIPVYTGLDEVGEIGTILGWGDHGIAGGKAPEKKVDGKLRRGENLIQHAEEGTLQYIMDSPKNNVKAAEKIVEKAWGTIKPRALEAIGWSGDSGGPMLISNDSDDDDAHKWTLVGVNSGGTCCKYGSYDEFARLSPKYSWIAESMRTSAAAPMNCTRGVKHPFTLGPGMCHHTWCDLGKEFTIGCSKTCNRCKVTIPPKAPAPA